MLPIWLTSRLNAVISVSWLLNLERRYLKKRIASLNELLRLEDGQGFRFWPIKNIEVEIDSVIRIFPSDAKLEKQCSVDISRVKIELPFETVLKDCLAAVGLAERASGNLASAV